MLRYRTLGGTPVDSNGRDAFGTYIGQPYPVETDFTWLLQLIFIGAVIFFGYVFVKVVCDSYTEKPFPERLTTDFSVWGVLTKLFFLIVFRKPLKWLTKLAFRLIKKSVIYYRKRKIVREIIEQRYFGIKGQYNVNHIYTNLMTENLDSLKKRKNSWRTGY